MNDETQKQRVLVVNDEHVLADVLTAVLNQAGYDASATYDGLAAVELAQTFCPDMLISDVFMPGLNGIEAAIRIREFLPSIRVLLMSSVAHEDLLGDARAQGYEFELVAIPFQMSDMFHWCDGKHDAYSRSWRRPDSDLNTREEWDALEAKAQLEAVKKEDSAGGAQRVPPTDHARRVGPTDNTDSEASQAAKTPENTAEGEKQTIQDKIKEITGGMLVVSCILGVVALFLVSGYLYLVGLRTAYIVGIPTIKTFLHGPDIPGGTYVPVRVSASSKHDYLPLLGPQRATLEAAITPPLLRLGPKELWALSGLDAKNGLRYEVECWPTPWNHCEPLDAGKNFYARWVSADHKQLAIATENSGEVSNGNLAPSSIVIYTVKGWKRVPLVDVPLVHARDLP